jgi:hypothetical protein
MRTLILLALLLVAEYCYCQPKGANTIKITGVTFRQVANALLDAGYSFEKIDSNFQTIRTEYKAFQNYIPRLRFEIRVKDSILNIKGDALTSNFQFSAENVKWKGAFNEMNSFALSFNKPVEYSISK